MKRAAAVTASALAVAGIAYAMWLRPWHLEWGCTEEEARQSLPGDDLTPQPRSQATHAITIHAPVAEVWKWIVQIGQNRAGFYSYSWLENLVGCRLRNADRIMPEFQDIKIGDSVWLHPKAPPLPLLHVEPGRDLVLGSNTGDAGTWSFHLRPLADNAVRLIVRSRGDWIPGPLGSLFQYGLFEPAHFIMERKMLLTIRHLAEHLPQATAAC